MFLRIKPFADRLFRLKVLRIVAYNRTNPTVLSVHIYHRYRACPENTWNLMWNSDMLSLLSCRICIITVLWSFLFVLNKDKSSSGHAFSCTKRKQAEFVKHARTFLTMVLAGDPWLGVWKIKQRPNTLQPATDTCTMKKTFSFRSQTAEQQLFDPCCLRDNREKGIFVISLQWFPCSFAAAAPAETGTVTTTLQQARVMLQAFLEL